MKRNVIVLLIAIILFCAPMPRKNIKYYQVGNPEEYSLFTALKTVIMPLRKREPIIDRLSSIEDVVEEIKPVIHIKYKNVVSRVKFRPQSARMVLDDAQNFSLIKPNICSIIRTRNFERVFCMEKGVANEWNKNTKNIYTK